MGDAGGLMKIRAPPPPINSNMIMLSGHAPPGATIEILPWTFFKFAVIAFQGNGEFNTAINIEVGSYPGLVEYFESVFPDWRITKVYANKAIRMTVGNGDPWSPRFYGTIYLIYLDW
jgi:hypothetical protein